MDASPRAPAVELLERERELERLEAAIAAAAGAGGIVALEGEPGIGKSSLLAHAIVVAKDTGMQVLRARR
ncbi:MAG: mS29 family ribosomal protein [Actinomycetota bacterium]|nr:mS29 family ribosomal protein [Actinomycetota bacterium]